MNLIQKGLQHIYNSYKKDTAKMLVVTGAIGWGLSALGQVFAIAINPKIDREQKGFLVPQALLDAAVNIGTFLMITQTTKKFVSKMASTGKIAPTKVREFLNKNKIYGNKTGKVDFDLDEVIKIEKDFPKESYYSYKNCATTVATVGASIFASNIATPVIRNYIASDIQKKYIDYRAKKSPSNGMKI